jgi:hypothetical protein
MQAPEHPCEGLPLSARRAFDRNAAAMPPPCSPKTLGVLLEKGLLEKRSRTIGSDRFGRSLRRNTRSRYSFTSRWCEWVDSKDSRRRCRPSPPGRKSADDPSQLKLAI